MILHGRNIIIKVDGVAIACARSCELNIETETIEVAHPSSGKWKKYLSGRSTWSVTTSHLASTGTNDNIRSLLTNLAKRMQTDDEMVTLQFMLKSPNEGMLKLQGKAIVTKGAVTATLGNLGQASWSFQGSGPLVDMNTTAQLAGTLSFNYKEDGSFIPASAGEFVTDKYYLQILDRYNTVATGYMVLLRAYYQEGVEGFKCTHVRPAEPSLYTLNDTTYYWDGANLTVME